MMGVRSLFAPSQLVPVTGGNFLFVEQWIDPTFVVAMVVDACVGIEANALEVIVHDEVHDAGHGVRAVGRGSAAGQHVHALDQGDGDLVNVGRGGERRIRPESRPGHRLAGAVR